jgi:hypothetical protein
MKKLILLLLLSPMLLFGTERVLSKEVKSDKIIIHTTERKIVVQGNTKQSIEEANRIEKEINRKHRESQR